MQDFTGERGALEVLRDIRFEVVDRRVRLDHRAERLRQDHAAAHPARARAGDERRESRYCGKPVESPSPSSAMVFQQFNLFPWLTVAQNVAFGLEVASVPPAECARAHGTVRPPGRARRLRSSTIRTSCPAACSSASASRARWRSIPHILLLDEPFGALDAITREQLQREIAGILAQSTEDRRVHHPQHGRGDLLLRPHSGDGLAPGAHPGRGARRAPAPARGRRGARQPAVRADARASVVAAVARRCKCR